MPYVPLHKHYQKKNHMRVRVRGKTFKSLEACAKHFDLHPKTVAYLLQQGRADSIGLGRGNNVTEAAIGAHPRSRQVEFHGLTFKSMTSAAKALGVNRRTITACVEGHASATDTVTRAAMAYRMKQETADVRRLPREPQEADHPPVVGVGETRGSALGSGSRPPAIQKSGDRAQSIARGHRAGAAHGVQSGG